MSESYENIVLLRGEEAARAIEILEERGEDAALEHLRQWHEPGEGTLVSSREDPWKASDRRYWRGDFVVYYDPGVPYIGLVNRISLER